MCTASLWTITVKAEKQNVAVFSQPNKFIYKQKPAREVLPSSRRVQTLHFCQLWNEKSSAYNGYSGGEELRARGHGGVSLWLHPENLLLRSLAGTRWHSLHIKASAASPYESLMVIRHNNTPCSHVLILKLALYQCAYIDIFPLLFLLPFINAYKHSHQHWMIMACMWSCKSLQWENKAVKLHALSFLLRLLDGIMRRASYFSLDVNT